MAYPEMMPAAESIATPERSVAPQAAGRCDALYEVYTTAGAGEAQAWRLVMLFAYATAVLIMLAVVLVLVGSQQMQVAAGGVALVSSVAAGAFATRATQKRKEMKEAASEYAKAGCGADRVLATFASE